MSDQAEVNHIVHISTNIGVSCEHCSESIGVDRFAESINHYINEHGYKLLHVGQETSEGSDGLWHHSVAVLGR